jgi:plasmid stabilization system protein ParE
VKRFILSPDANHDLDEIESFLDAIPSKPAIRFGAALQAMLWRIAENPLQGAVQSELSRLCGDEVRSRFVAPWRIFHHPGGSVPEIIGILHTARDVAAIMTNRLQ